MRRGGGYRRNPGHGPGPGPAKPTVRTSQELVDVTAGKPVAVGEVAVLKTGYLTVTVSVNDATFSSAFTVAVNPRPTRMPSRLTVEKPASS